MVFFIDNKRTLYHNLDKYYIYNHLKILMIINK